MIHHPFIHLFPFIYQSTRTRARAQTHTLTLFFLSLLLFSYTHDNKHSNDFSCWVCIAQCQYEWSKLNNNCIYGMPCKIFELLSHKIWLPIPNPGVIFISWLLVTGTRMTNNVILLLNRFVLRWNKCLKHALCITSNSYSTAINECYKHNFDLNRSASSHVALWLAFL